MKKSVSLLFIMALALVGATALSAQNNEDWTWTKRFAKANAEMTTKPKAVLYGDSVTEYWPNIHPDFFTENNFVGRGIGGQTTSQILVRMREDVVKLKPKYVVILCGINDIALNQGHAVNVEQAVGSIKSMCDIAKKNGIKPIVCSIPGSFNIAWRPEVKNCFEQVVEFNDLLRAYAKENHIKFVDYFTLLSDGTGHVRTEYAKDTVHPTPEGYTVMENYLKGFIK